MQILYRCWGWNRGTNGPGFSGKLMPSEKSLASIKWDSTRRDLSVNNGLSVKQVSKSLTPELWIQIDSPNFTYPINVGGHSKLVQLVISAIKHLGHTDIQVISHVAEEAWSPSGAVPRETEYSPATVPKAGQWDPFHSGYVQVTPYFLSTSEGAWYLDILLKKSKMARNVGYLIMD